MHNSSHGTFHLRELLRLTRILNQPTNLENFILIAVVLTHRLIGASQPVPSLISHSSVESIAELQANLLSDALLLSQLLESRKVGHLVPNKFHGTVGTVEV